MTSHLLPRHAMALASHGQPWSFLDVFGRFNPFWIQIRPFWTWIWPFPNVCQEEFYEKKTTTR